MDTHSHRFPAMGSSAHVLVVGGPTDLVDRAVDRIERLESLWSRFRADSEVSRLNAALLEPPAPGEEPPVSPETQLLLDRAAEGFRVTSGRFDPYRLDVVTATGYDTSFESLATPPTSLAGHPSAPRQGFDPGGIGKGLAADLVSEELMAAGAAGVLVGIGGDLRVRGVSPEGGDWLIEIEDPRTAGAVTRSRWPRAQSPRARSSNDDGPPRTAPSVTTSSIHVPPRPPTRPCSRRRSSQPRDGRPRSSARSPSSTPTARGPSRTRPAWPSSRPSAPRHSW